ncbi:MAG: hypothetical protein FWG99_00450 [Treponema sp.]|nr:hypothetical protein [Treponema sp.]
MWRWLNNVSLVLLCVIAVSCGFADLRPIEIRTDPCDYESLLPDAYTPVMLSFNTGMRKHDTEGIMQISSDAGVVNGDRYWKGNDLYFVPVQGWTAGARYTLSLSGIVRSTDGRELRVERFVPFFAVNKSPPPLLEWFSPGEDASVGTTDTVMEFRFSSPMERLSVETALTVDGMGNKTFEWLLDDTHLRVIPEKNLIAWTTYRWTLKESAKSRDGVPLPGAISSRFVTNLDQVMPQVTRAFPVLNSMGRWLPTGAELSTGLGSGQAIAVEFNKVMDENVLRSMRFEPSITGRTELLSEKTIIYIFNRNPEPETAYTLVVSGDTKDSEGLKIGEDYRISFIPDIPFLKILSFNADNAPSLMNFGPSGDMGALEVPVDPAFGEFSFTIRFSAPFGNEEKQNAALKIFLFPFFPKNLPPIALRSANWISSDRLRMTWEGLRAGSSGEPNYYKLLIPGGKGGIENGQGMYLREDQFLFLEAIK